MATSAKNVNDPSLETKGSKRDVQTVTRDGKEYEEYVIVKPDYEPYEVELTIKNAPGCGILFHAFDVQDYRKKEQAKKGSREKKEDNVEAYVYRDGDGNMCIPGLNMKAAICNAAKKFKDPSSTRASAKDLIRGGIVVDPFMSPLLRDGKPIKTWDTLDQRGVVVNQSRVIRARPLLTEDWALKFTITVNDSELISPEFLHDIVQRSCNFSGLGDYRPDFGRFVINEFRVRKEIMAQAA